MTTSIKTTGKTTNRSDFTWPYLAERQRIFNWDRYEYKERQQPHSSDMPPTLPPTTRLFLNMETLNMVPDSQKLRFDFYFRPKPILGRPLSVGHFPTEKVIEYDKDKASARLSIQRTRPRVFKYPQISLDDVSDDKRDMVCTFVYSTSKTMSELTSGVPEACPINVDIPSKPFSHLGKFQRLPLNTTINPVKNWRRVSIEWDESQRRIFGGRSVD